MLQRRNDADEDATAVTAVLASPPQRDAERRERAAEMERSWSGRQPHSYMHASGLAHMMVQTCADLADKGGGGEGKVSSPGSHRKQVIQ